MKIKITNGQSVILTTLDDIDPAKDLIAKLSFILKINTYQNDGYCDDINLFSNDPVQEEFCDMFCPEQENGFLLHYDKEHTGSLIITGCAAYGPDQMFFKNFIATVEKIAD